MELWLTIAVCASFAAIGLRRTTRDADAYVAARRTQSAWGIGLSFFASSLGAWILFGPPEFGALGLGILAIAGYAVGQAAAVGVFAWFGPAVRARVPSGSSILDFVRQRYGRGMEGYTAVISALYMFLFLTAELVAVKGVLGLLGGVNPWAAVTIVAGASAVYTMAGGLPASLATDRWQAWMVAGLVGVGAVALLTRVDAPLDAARAGGLGAITRPGAESALILIVAIVAANLFHQGFWQRVWAASDDAALRRGTTWAGLAIVPVLLFTGFTGMVAAGRGDLDVPALGFFSLVEGSSDIVVAVVVVLAVTLVASTTDTLQNALTSLAARGGRSLGTARLVTLALTVPAVVIAVNVDSVLRLLLIADLFAATIAVPVFLGLWGRVTPAAAVAGSVAGLLAIVAVGWTTNGSFVEGLRVLTLPGLPSVGAFVAAPVASGAVTVAIASRPRADRGADPASIT